MRPHVVGWLARFLPDGLASLVAPTWFTCVGLAGLVCLFVLAALARRDRIEQRVVASIVLWCYVAAVIAGIVVPMAIDAVEQLVATGELRVRWAGMTSFWGYLAGIAAVICVCRAHRIPLARLADLAAAPMGLALLCARIGCFLAGCDYGKVTSLPWAVRFPAGSPAWRDQLRAGLLPPERLESLPVHPTQLYEAALGLAMFAVAFVLVRRAPRWVRARDGRVFLLCAALYAIGRLAIETVRGDLGRGIYDGMSSGQIFSIAVLAVVGVAWLATAPRRRALLTAIAATAIVLAVIEPGEATAQPAPTAAADPPIELGLLIGNAVAINRRTDQVPALAGVTLSAGYGIGGAGVWLDLDAFTSSEASHRTGLLSGSYLWRTGRLSLGGRVGIGVTQVMFASSPFASVTGSDFRVEGLAEYRFGAKWTAWARVTPFDLLSAADLGGSIVTYQLRLGVAYRFGEGRVAAAGSGS